jgi:DNA-binding protein YbaB
MTTPDFSELIESARRLVAASGGTPQTDEEPVELQGVGESPGGLVRVTAVAGGRIDSVTIDPRGMRTDSHSLGEEVAAAVNAALDDLRGQASAAAGAAIDTERLSEQLRQVQESSVRQLGTFLQTIAAAQERITTDRR